MAGLVPAMTAADFMRVENALETFLRALPLPVGERVGVRGSVTLDSLKPLTRRAARVDLSLWER